MIRAQHYIEELTHAMKGLDRLIFEACSCDLDKIVDVQTIVQGVIDELRGEQAEYRAKAEDDNRLLYGDKDQRRGL